MKLLIPYDRGDMVSMLYSQGTVERESHLAEGTLLDVYVPDHLLEQVERFELEAESNRGSA
jgi:GTP-binding protein HflX